MAEQEARKLNALMPGLSLTINEQTGMLDQNTNSIYANIDSMKEQALAQARMEKNKQITKAWTDAVIDLEEAQLALNVAVTDEQEARDAQKAAFERMRELETEAAANNANPQYIQEYQDLKLAIADYDGAIYVAEQTQNKLNKEIKNGEEVAVAAEKEMDAYTQSQNGVTVASDEVTEATADLTEEMTEAEKQFEALQKRNEELTAVTRTLCGANDLLKQALDEQEKSGSVSIDTALELIEAGYMSAVTIDAETGAVMVNRDAYIQVTKAKIDEQIQSIASQKSSVDATIRLQQERIAAYETAIGYYEKADAERASLDVMKTQSAAFGAQIAALNGAKNTVGSYAKAVTSSAASSTSASKSIATQAGKDLAAFKALRETLDHELAVGEISEKEHYAKLKEYRDKYLTDDENLDDYRKIKEEIYKYDQQLAADEDELWADQTGKLIGELEARFNEVMAKQDEMTKKLAGYGDLFTIKDGKMSLENIDNHTKALLEYDKTLDQLKANGISDGLMNEVLSMSIDDAIAYGDQLLAMEPETWKTYNETYEKNQQLAKEIASKFYADNLKTLKTEMDELNKTAFGGGQNLMQGVFDGISSKKQAVYDELTALRLAMDAVLSARTELDVKKDGSHAGGLPYVPFDGYVAELHEGERVLTADEAKAYFARSMPRSFNVPSSRPSAETQTAAVVNGIVGGLAQIMPSSGGGIYHIHIEMGDKEVAGILFDPLKEVSRQRGETL